MIVNVSYCSYNVIHNYVYMVLSMSNFTCIKLQTEHQITQQLPLLAWLLINNLLTNAHLDSAVAPCVVSSSHNQHLWLSQKKCCEEFEDWNP